MSDDAAQIGALLKLANEPPLHDHPPGSGSGLSGGSVPIEDAV